MSDKDNTPEGTTYRERSEAGRSAPAKHDAWDRKDVSDQPGQSPKNRENVEDFGFISQELATDELETPEPEVDEKTDEDKG